MRGRVAALSGFALLAAVAGPRPAPAIGTVTSGNCAAGFATCSFNIPGTCSGPVEGQCDGDLCTNDFDVCAGGVEANVVNAGTMDVAGQPVQRRVRAHVFFGAAADGEGGSGVAWECHAIPTGDAETVAIGTCSVESLGGGLPVDADVVEVGGQEVVARGTATLPQGRIRACIEATVDWSDGTSTAAGPACNTFAGSLA